jgi:hypothetical protein
MYSKLALHAIMLLLLQDEMFFSCMKEETCKVQVLLKVHNDFHLSKLDFEDDVKATGGGFGMEYIYIFNP